MNDIFSRIIIDQDKLQNRIKELGEEISVDYKDEKVVLVCVMNGSVLFTVDLLKNISIPVEIDFVTVASYHGGTASTGKIDFLRDLQIEDIENYHLLIIEDILDTGRTLSCIIDHLKTKNPKSLKICSLIDKPEKRIVKDIKLDYTGFVLPDIFIVGYGMDYEQKYRSIPYIGELKPEVYS